MCACSASASRRKAAVNAEGDRYPVALATAATGMPLARNSRAWARRCWRSHSMAPRPSSSRHRAVNWLGLRCTRRARSATVISWCHSRAAHCCSCCQSMARLRELAEAEGPPVGRLCVGEGDVLVPPASQASSSSAGPWACARGRPCCSAWARYCCPAPGTSCPVGLQSRVAHRTRSRSLRPAPRAALGLQSPAPARLPGRRAPGSDRGCGCQVKARSAAVTGHLRRRAAWRLGRAAAGLTRQRHAPAGRRGSCCAPWRPQRRG